MDVIYWKHKLKGAENDYTEKTASIHYKNLICYPTA
jgi:hypothetical protein